MSFLKKLASSTVATMMIKDFAAPVNIFHGGSESRSLCDTFTHTLLEIEQGASWGWIKKALLYGGSIAACSYTGYKLWQYWAKNQKNDRDDTDSEELPENTLWSEMAGNEWAGGDVPYDPVYGVPPWLEKQGGDLSPDPQFTIPDGASWADICPEEVVEVQTEAPYQLPEDEDVDDRVLKTVWGMSVIWEEEEDDEDNKGDDDDEEEEEEVEN